MAWGFVNAGAVSTGASPTPALPSGYAEGNLLLIVATSGATFSTAPTGYTQIALHNASPFLAIWYKFAGASETAQTVTNSNTATAAVVLAYSGINSYDVISTVKTASATTIATNTTTTTAANDLVLSIYGGGVASSGTRAWTPPASTTSRVSRSRTTTTTGMLVCDENLATATTTTARTGTTAQTATLDAYTVAFKQANTFSESVSETASASDSVAQTFSANKTVSESASATDSIEGASLTNRYWVGGTGTWDASSTTHWSATNGGSGGASVPTSGTNVFFNGSSDSGTSFVVTLSGAINCKDLTISGLDQAMTFAIDSNLNIYGNLSYPASNLTLSGTQTLIFKATDTGHTISTNNIANATSNITCDGVGGEWTLLTDLTCAILLIINGSFITANKTINGTAIKSNQAGTRSITLGSSSIYLTTGDSTPVDIGNETNLTLNAGTSHLYVNARGITLKFGSTVTWYDISSTYTNDTWWDQIRLEGNITCHNLIIYGYQNTAGMWPHYYELSNMTAITCSGLFQKTAGLARNSQTLFHAPNATAGTNSQITITAASFDLNDIHIYGITFAGAGIPATGTSISDGGNCSNVTFTTPKTSYYVGGGGGYMCNNNWSNTSGGTVNTNYFPLGQDTIIVDNNSASTLACNWYWGSFSKFDASNRTSAFTFDISTTIVAGGANGGLNLSSSVTFSSGQIIFQGSGTATITASNSISNDTAISINAKASSASVQIASNSKWGGVQVYAGTLDLNGNALTVKSVNVNSANTKTIAYGTNGKLQLTYGWGNSNICYYALTNISVTGTGGIYLGGGSGSESLTLFNSDTAVYGESVSNIYIQANLSSLNFDKCSAKNLDFTGATIGSANFGNAKVYGDLTITTGLSTISTTDNSLTFASTNATVRNITSAGKTFNQPIEFNGVGGSWKLLDNFSLNTSRTQTLTNGTFDLNGYTNTVGVFSSNNANTRALTFGAGKLSLSASSGLNLSSSISVNYSTGSSIEFTSASGQTLAGGGTSLPTIRLAGAGGVTVTGANTFADMVNSVQPTSLTLPASITTTFEAFNLRGTAGNLVTVISSTSTVQATVSKASDIVDCDYLSLRDSNATGGATWYAGSNSTSVSNNTGWLFSKAPKTGLLSETASASESIEGVAPINKALSETASATDSLSALFNVYVAASETASATDDPSAIFTVFKALAESASATESVSNAISTTQTLSETASATDTVLASFAIFLALAESASATDGYAQSKTGNMALSETASASDSIAATFNVYMALAEGASATDAVSAIFTVYQALSESASASDSYAQSKTANLTVSETTSATDNIAALETAIAAIAESASATDAVTAIFNVYQVLSETVSATDAITVLLAALGALSESASATDSFVGGSAYVGALSESASATESQSASFSITVTLSESAGSSDSVVGNWTTNVALSETAGTGESALANFIVNKVLSETASATDSATTTFNAVGAISETASATDSVSNVSAAVVLLSETASAADSVVMAFAANKTVSETASASEGVTVIATEIGLLSETASASDDYTQAKITLATISETASGTDSVLNFANRVAELSESASATELQAAIFNVYQTLSETASATESVDGIGGNYVSVSESASATETITALFNVYMALSESASASDSNSGANSTNQAVTETATATEGIAVLANVFKSLSESVSATDSADNAAIRVGAVSETATADSSQDADFSNNAIVIESVSATESASGLWTTLAVVLESASATESLQVNINVQTSVLESAVAGDSQSATALWLASLAESASASDMVQGARITDSQIVEVIVVGDTVFSAIPLRSTGAFLVFFTGAGLAPIVH